MSETETPAELRLRVLKAAQGALDLSGTEVAAIDMGREALALLREWADAAPLHYAGCNCCMCKARALLARAGEE